jgi:hypothetical protein
MSLMDEWQGVLGAAESDDYSSPGTHFGLMLDPNRWLAEAAGYGDKYKGLINKTGYYANKAMSKAGEPMYSLARKNTPGREDGNELDRGMDFAEKKPASTTGLLLGSYFGGSGLMGGGGEGGGMFGNMFGGGQSSSVSPWWGSQGETIPGIAGNTSTGTGIFGNSGWAGGATNAGTASGEGLMAKLGGWQGAAKMGQGLMPQQQQQQDTGPKPYLWKGRLIWM